MTFSRSVLELRQRGLSWTQVARQLRCTSSARKAGSMSEFDMVFWDPKKALSKYFDGNGVVERMDRPGTCALCGGEIGPDATVVRNPICYSCGDPELIPHRGDRCHRCGGELVAAQLGDLACRDCDLDGYRE